MTQEEFTEVFNMGRSYLNMPYGFNEKMKEHWKYKDAEEAFALYGVVGQSEQLNCEHPIEQRKINHFTGLGYCGVCDKNT